MNALQLLDRYGERHPDRVRILGPVEQDCGFRIAMAIELISPTGKRYRRGLRWPTRHFEPRVAGVALAQFYRRKLKRWLRT